MFSKLAAPEPTERTHKHIVGSDVFGRIGYPLLASQLDGMLDGDVTHGTLYVVWLAPKWWVFYVGRRRVPKTCKSSKVLSSSTDEPQSAAGLLYRRSGQIESTIGRAYEMQTDERVRRRRCEDFRWHLCAVSIERRDGAMR